MTSDLSSQVHAGPGRHVVSRRSALRRLSTVLGAGLVTTPRWSSATGGARDSARDRADDDRRVEGLLIGSLIGDAAGGPLEFKSRDILSEFVTPLRERKNGGPLTDKEISALRQAFRLVSYADFRPKPAPYAHWTKNAPAGTVTDDSRHKIFLFRALSKAEESGKLPISVVELAREYASYADSKDVRKRGYRDLAKEWLAEYSKAARWVLGERDLSQALPPSRLWGGVPSNAGQMALLPIAGLYPGQPDAAYRAAYALSFMDNGVGKDINAALVAGLATALRVAVKQKRAAPDASAWQAVERSLRDSDPYRFAKVPWVHRAIRRHLDFAASAYRKSGGNPPHLYRILEKESGVRIMWEAGFIVESVFALFRMCRYDPLASLAAAIDFGHDNDSSAQLMGAFVGAIHGPEVFPRAMRDTVAARFFEDYGERVADWVALLRELRETGKTAIRFLESRN